MPSAFGELNPPQRLLMGPGPSDAHPRVMRAMMTPILGHLDPEFLAIMSETQEMLRQVFRTKNQLTFPVSGTGSAGMETCVVNLIEHGDKMIVCTKGYFGQRLAEMAGRAGAQLTVMERPMGEVFDLNQIRDALKKIRPKVLGIVHVETSAGSLQSVEELGKLCHEHDTLLLMDCVTSMACTPLEVDKWEIDAVCSCTQKGLGCPPGLGPVTFSPRAVEAMSRRKTKVQSWYMDMTQVQRYWSEERFYHHTAPITMTYAMREGLRIVLEEGLENRWTRHIRNHKALKAGLLALGLNYATNEANIAPQLNCVRIPQGMDDVPVRKRMLNEFNIEIGGGLGEFKGKVWRIGLMGYNSEPRNVLLVLATLEKCLLSQGMKQTPGAGVGAAVQAYNAL